MGSQSPPSLSLSPRGSPSPAPSTRPDSPPAGQPRGHQLTSGSLTAHYIKTKMAQLIDDSAKACNQRRMRAIVHNVARSSAKGTVDTSPDDPPLPDEERLRQVAVKAMDELDSIGNHLVKKIVMPSIEPPPRGVIWSRLRTNLKAPKEFEEDFFVPYLGESEENLKTSTKLANDLMAAPTMDEPETCSEEALKRRILAVIRKSTLMAGQHEKILNQADDSDAEGELMFHKTPDLDEYIDGMWGRAHKRMAIRNVAKAFPASMWPKLVNHLCQMLGISYDAVMRYLSNAMYRENKWLVTEYENHERRMHEELIVVQSREMPKPRNSDILNSNSVKYFFCRQCYTYDCQMHGDDTAKPLVLPFDNTRKENLPELNRKQIEDACRWKVDGVCFYQTQPPNPDMESMLCTHPELGILAKEIRQHYGEDYCRIAQAMYYVESDLRGLTCRDVGLFFFFSHGGAPPETGHEADAKKNKRSRKNKATEQLFVGSTKNRPDYEACNHKGPCTKASGCICVKKGLPCEKFCGCNLARVCGDRVQTKSVHYCNRSFMGCDCKSENACRTNACECYANDRECDPDLCGACMSCTTNANGKEVLKCKNSSLRLKEHHRVVVGRSRVHGWGTYSTGHIPKGDLVGEYVGEVIVHDHAERRGRVYDKIDYTFLFTATLESTVDSTRMGNKLRFCNHSVTPNCNPKLVRVCGDVRVGLYANKDIKPFEELFFDYGFGANGPAWAQKGKKKGGKKMEGETASRKCCTPTEGGETDADESSGESVGDADFVPPNGGGAAGRAERRALRNRAAAAAENAGEEGGLANGANGTSGTSGAGPSKRRRLMNGDAEVLAAGAEAAAEGVAAGPAPVVDGLNGGNVLPNGTVAPVVNLNSGSDVRGVSHRVRSDGGQVGGAPGLVGGGNGPSGGTGQANGAVVQEVVNLISDSE